MCIVEVKLDAMLAAQLCSVSDSRSLQLQHNSLAEGVLVVSAAQPALCCFAWHNIPMPQSSESFSVSPQGVFMEYKSTFMYDRANH